MHIDVRDDKNHPFYKEDYFAQYFDELNYTVGVFGKHLNNDNPTGFVPRGVDEMLINGGGAYLDPTFTFGTGGNAPKEVKFNDCLPDTGMPCYSTSVIGNTSLFWMERQVQSNPQKPFLSIISVKAPHIQDGPNFPVSIPAPWYSDTVIPEEIAPRTPNYNFSAPDHHWLVRTQKPLTKLEATKVDELYVSRLKTLLSVDDLVEELFQKLEDLQVLDNTYILFTSDNGFRLGQFRMPEAKLHPYENDVRVPMMILGPGIAPGSVSSLLSTHVNLMPTLLGLATNQLESQDIIPATMDGINLASHILDSTEEEGLQQTPPPSSLLIEYNSLGPVVRYNHLVDTYNHSFMALRIIDHHKENGGGLPVNYKYIEFRDSRQDWNATAPALEREFFDLGTDPFELRNLIRHVSPVLLQSLEAKMHRLFHCKGASCREEQLTALPGLLPSWTESLSRSYY